MGVLHSSEALPSLSSHWKCCYFSSSFSAMATYIHPHPILPLLLFFSIKMVVFDLPHIFPGTSASLSLVYVKVSLQPVISQWTKGWNGKWRTSWAFYIRSKSIELSISCRAVFELADQQQFASGLTALHVTTTTTKKAATWVRKEIHFLLERTSWTHIIITDQM